MSTTTATSFSLKSLTLSLALTASVTQANLAQLLNLQSEMVAEIENTYPEHLEEEHHSSEHHFNEMAWETLGHEEGAHCPVGFTRVGCCKCVHDALSATHHIAEIGHDTPQIHGSDGHHEIMSTSHEALPSTTAPHHESMANANVPDYRGQMFSGHEPYHTEHDHYHHHGTSDKQGGQS